MTVIGINTGGLGGENAATIQAFIQQTGVTFPVVEDLGQSYGSWVQAAVPSPFPLDIVIDRDGYVIYISHEYDAAELLQAVQVDL